MNVATTTPVINMIPNGEAMPAQQQGTLVDFAAALEAADGFGAVVEDTSNLLNAEAGQMNNSQEQEPTVAFEQVMPLLAAQSGFVPAVQVAEMKIINIVGPTEKPAEAAAVLSLVQTVEAKPADAPTGVSRANTADYANILSGSAATGTAPVALPAEDATPDKAIEAATVMNVPATETAPTKAAAAAPASPTETPLPAGPAPVIETAVRSSESQKTEPTTRKAQNKPSADVEIALQEVVVQLDKQKTTSPKSVDVHDTTLPDSAEPLVDELTALPKANKTGKGHDDVKSAPPTWAKAWQNAKPAEHSNSALNVQQDTQPVIAPEVSVENQPLAAAVTPVLPQQPNLNKGSKANKNDDVQPITVLEGETAETDPKAPVLALDENDATEQTDPSDTKNEEKDSKNGPTAWANAWQNAKPAEKSHSPLNTVTPPEAVADTTPATGAEITRQIIDKAEMTWQNGDQTIKIKLKPDNFGEVQITLVKSETGITAQIKTDNEHTSHLLTTQINQLQESLQNKGLTFSRIDIQYQAGSDLASRQQSQSNQTDRQNQTRRASGSSRSSAIKTETAINQTTAWAGSNKIDYLA